MSNDLGASRQYLSKALKELQDNNYIRVERRGLNKTNVYTILSIQDRWEKHKKKLGKTNSSVSTSSHRFLATIYQCFSIFLLVYFLYICRLVFLRKNGCVISTTLIHS